LVVGRRGQEGERESNWFGKEPSFEIHYNLNSSPLDRVHVRNDVRGLERILHQSGLVCFFFEVIDIIFVNDAASG
jgi:hypothetical protein